MSIGRLRTGELTAVAGSVGLFVLLFFNWFGVKGIKVPPGAHGFARLTGIHQTGWASLGWLMVVLLCIAILGGLTIAYMVAKRSTPAWQVGAAVLTWSTGGLIFLILLIRVLTQPGLGARLPNSVVTVNLPAYLGLLFAFLIAAGAWRSLADERKDAPESAYTPPPPRPIPGT